jgi:hypothetical protein
LDEDEEEDEDEAKDMLLGKEKQKLNMDTFKYNF